MILTKNVSSPSFGFGFSFLVSLALSLFGETGQHFHLSVLTTIKNGRNQNWQMFRSLAVRRSPTGSLLPGLPWCSVGPESSLTVPLCTQLPGNRGGEIKLSLEQFYWDFVPERNGINKHQEKQLLKPCAPEQAGRQMLGNLYPALIKWPPGHTPLRLVVAGNDTRAACARFCTEMTQAGLSELLLHPQPCHPRCPYCRARARG